MTAPTSLVWDLAGRPEPIPTVAALLKDQPGTCAVSGDHEERTADVNRALGTNFTDRTMFHDPSSSLVGPAALWCCSGKPPATLRMWSIVAAPGHDLGASHEKSFLQDTPGLLLVNRSNPGPITSILADPPEGEWLVSVATSGQKHVLPYTTVNRGSGRWKVRVENTTVSSTPEQWRHIHEHALALRRLGVPADDVLTGTPRYLKTRADLDAWQHHNQALTEHLGSPLLSLALWTVTKGTMTDD